MQYSLIEALFYCAVQLYGFCMVKGDKWTKMVYYVVYGLGHLLSLLPFWFLYLLSDGLFLLLYYCVKYRRNVVRDNLVKSFPEKSSGEIIKIEKKFYHFFCDYFVETMKLVTISRKAMKKRMVFHGVDMLEKALLDEGHNFAFVYLGHYGNWEWIASLPYFLPGSLLCAQIYHPLYDKAMDRFFLRLRSQFGGECIPMKQTLRRVIELKREKRPTVIGFISDQLPKWNSMHFFVPFLHRETAVFTGAEQIGRQVKAVYFFADIIRPRRGYYECTFRRMEIPEVSRTEYDMTAMFMEQLEQMIRRAPQYWLWTHKRWKRTKEEWLRRQQDSTIK